MIGLPLRNAWTAVRIGCLLMFGLALNLSNAAARDLPPIDSQTG